MTSHDLSKAESSGYGGISSPTFCMGETVATTICRLAHSDMAIPSRSEHIMLEDSPQCPKFSRTLVGRRIWESAGADVLAAAGSWLARSALA